LRPNAAGNPSEPILSNRIRIQRQRPERRAATLLWRIGVTDWLCSADDLFSLVGVLRAEGGKGNSVKRSFGKTMAIIGWAVGSMAAAAFVCFLLFGVFLTHRFSMGVAFVLAICIWASWQGFEMFRSERNSK